MTEPKKVRVKVNSIDLSKALFSQRLPRDDIELDATLIEEEQKKEWPKAGNDYFVPRTSSMSEHRYFKFTYLGDDSIDKFYFDNHIACKTKEEAIELANFLIEKAKEWRLDKQGRL